MNFQFNNFQFKIKSRFFVILTSLILVGILFGSNLLLKKRIEVKLVDSGTNGSVLAVNNNSSDLIEPGQNIDPQTGLTQDQIGGPIGSPKDAIQAPRVNGSDISTYEPVTISYTVKEGDTVQSVAQKFHADAQTIVDFPNNGLQETLELKVGQILIIPNGYIDGSERPVLPPIAQGTGQFAWPVAGQITQYAFYWHPGAIDIAVPMRKEVVAADDGTVKLVQYLSTGYGVHVIIEHGDGLTSLYGHLSEARVTQGQGIHKGDLVGLSGSTGHSTGPHLHFEVRRNGIPVDPMTLLPSQ